MHNNSSVHLREVPVPEAPSPHGVYVRLTALEATQATQQARIALLESQVSALQAQVSTLAGPAHSEGAPMNADQTPYTASAYQDAYDRVLRSVDGDAPRAARMMAQASDVAAATGQSLHQAVDALFFSNKPLPPEMRPRTTPARYEQRAMQQARQVRSRRAARKQAAASRRAQRSKA